MFNPLNLFRKTKMPTQAELQEVLSDAIDNSLIHDPKEGKDENAIEVPVAVSKIKIKGTIKFGKDQKTNDKELYYIEYGVGGTRTNGMTFEDIREVYNTIKQMMDKDAAYFTKVHMTKEVADEYRGLIKVQEELIKNPATIEKMIEEIMEGHKAVAQFHKDVKIKVL